MAGPETQYQVPSVVNTDACCMTYDDITIRTAGIFVTILTTGVLCWDLVTNETTFALGAMMALTGVIGSLILGLVNSFK